MGRVDKEFINIEVNNLDQAPDDQVESAATSDQPGSTSADNAAAGGQPGSDTAQASSPQPAADHGASDTRDGQANGSAEEGLAVTPEQELLDLRERLENAEAKAEENWNQFLRARAEIDNLRRRGERDLENAHKFGFEKFATELLPVKDSLELGIAASTEEGVDAAKIREGAELTLKMLESALSKFGIEPVDPLGEKFNPELHEAMAMQPSNSAAPNTVLQVIQKGYLLNKRIMRPAMVIVARAAD